jgi:hypothetical protein
VISLYGWDWNAYASNYVIFLVVFNVFILPWCGWDRQGAAWRSRYLFGLRVILWVFALAEEVLLGTAKAATVTTAVT